MWHEIEGNAMILTKVKTLKKGEIWREKIRHMCMASI
jgi:hypothetical protein